MGVQQRAAWPRPGEPLDSGAQAGDLVTSECRFRLQSPWRAPLGRSETREGGPRQRGTQAAGRGGGAEAPRWAGATVGASLTRWLMTVGVAEPQTAEAGGTAGAQEPAGKGLALEGAAGSASARAPGPGNTETANGTCPRGRHTRRAPRPVGRRPARGGPRGGAKWPQRNVAVLTRVLHRSRRPARGRSDCRGGRGPGGEGAAAPRGHAPPGRPPAAPDADADGEQVLRRAAGGAQLRKGCCTCLS